MTNILRVLVVLFAVTSPAAWAQAQPVPPSSAAQPRSVTIGVSEFNRLSDLAGRPAPVASPVAAVLATADLRVRVEPAGARGVFALTGRVLQAGVQRLPILTGGTVLDVRSAAGVVPLAADGPTVLALVTGPNPVALTVDWGAPIHTQPGRAGFVLPVPPAGAARAVIDLPGENAEVRLSAGLVTRRASSGGRTVVEATLDPGAATEVSWSIRDSAPAAPAAAARVVAEVMTLVTIGDADVRMAALIEVSAARGALGTLALDLPAGYELLGVTGPTVESVEPRDAGVVVTLAAAPSNHHQCLVTLERSLRPDDPGLDTDVVRVRDAQRERGHVAVQGTGPMALSAADRAGVERIDVREVAAPLHAMARWPLLSAFRYQRGPGTSGPRFGFAVARFPEARVIPAVAEFGIATTLVTAEGRALTEVRLQMQNRAQPFLKVALAPGAAIISVDLAGEPAKPVSGPDGTRVPLLRAGLAGLGSYEVSFVYVHAGTPFARKGDLPIALPALDVPVGVMNWEIFVPDQYAARVVGGNAIDAHIYEARRADHAVDERVAMPVVAPGGRVRISLAPDAAAGQIRGTVRDMEGGVIPGAAIELRAGGAAKTAVSREDGTFVFGNVPAGQVALAAMLMGFTTQTATLLFDSRARQVDFTLALGALTETITVSGSAPAEPRGLEPPSPNVLGLQQRAAGVLPIRLDVPRAGHAYTFVRPLVVNNETHVTLRYKRR